MLNQKSIDLIKEFEGCVLTAYKDAVGVWTIGYGHTSAAGDPKVKAGLKISQEEAENILRNDLVKYEDMVKRNVKVTLNENQYGALTSFTYNLGEGNLKSSTLLKKVNAKDFSGAAKEFAKWNKAGGKVLAGLTRRREAERKLFELPASATYKPVEKLPDVPSTPQPSKPETSVQPSVSILEVLLEFILNLLRKK